MSTASLCRRRCCSLDDVYDARRVAEELGFPFYVLNLERDFERDVVEPFVKSYLEGETPIPCVACNSRLKFASLDRLARSLGCDKVATGHYARVVHDEAANRYRLLRGRDARKDQTYFLWELTQEQLAHAMFPLGEMEKAEVREAARGAKLYVAEKKESQEICFVPDGDYAGFIDRYLEAEGRETQAPGRGEIVDARGQVLGEHGGIHRYTVGQRRGLGLSRELPLYVVRVEAEANRVVVGHEDELLCDGVRRRGRQLGRLRRAGRGRPRRRARPLPPHRSARPHHAPRRGPRPRPLRRTAARRHARPGHRLLPRRRGRRRRVDSEEQ